MIASNFASDWKSVVIGWDQIGIPAVVFLCCVAAGLIARRVLFSWIRRWKVDTEVIPVLRSPLVIWAVILGFDFATRSSTLPPHYVKPIKIGLEALWILSITIVAGQVLGNLVRKHTERSQGHAPTLIKTLTEIFVAILGLLFLLNYLNVNIGPLLATLGVGGLAVALALQDTLSNLFAGIYISISNQIHVGDYIKLSSGEEGYVIDINWRSTRLRSLANNYTFIPNSKLGQTIFTNYHLPTKNTGMSIAFHVPFDADTDRVEALMLEEATREKIEGLATEPLPSLLWSPVGDSWLLFTLNFDVEEFSKQFSVQSELRKRIFKRFRKEGIALPYPTQTLLFTPSQPGQEPLPLHSQP
jgi:small-conductance mechanosensitive channel